MVRNLTSGKILSKNAKVARNFIDRSFGMLLARNSSGIVLHTGFGIHTLFMKMPIDIVVIDKNKKIVQIKENLMPFRFMIWNPVFDTVIELENGTIKESGSKLGDKLDF